MQQLAFRAVRAIRHFTSVTRDAPPRRVPSHAAPRIRVDLLHVKRSVRRSTCAPWVRTRFRAVRGGGPPPGGRDRGLGLTPLVGIQALLCLPRLRSTWPQAACSRQPRRERFLLNRPREHALCSAADAARARRDTPDSRCCSSRCVALRLRPPARLLARVPAGSAGCVLHVKHLASEPRRTAHDPCRCWVRQREARNGKHA